VNLAERKQSISSDVLGDGAISKGEFLPQTAPRNLSDALCGWYHNGGINAVSEFATQLAS
jgi:hypothetical protein